MLSGEERVLAVGRKRRQLPAFSSRGDREPCNPDRSHLKSPCAAVASESKDLPCGVGAATARDALLRILLHSNLRTRTNTIRRQ
eukprot:1188093-Prorocentrum_minimum.AAC.2